MKKTLLTILTLTSLSQFAFANECIITTDRKACAGKEAEMLKPYAGKNPTEDKKKAKDAADCKAQAEKSSKIVRKGTLAGKTVTAAFGSEKFGPFSDTAECK